MRQDSNRHDSAFMWTLTNDPSPEAFRQNYRYSTPNAIREDDSLSLGAVADDHQLVQDSDDSDLCGSLSLIHI